MSYTPPPPDGGQGYGQQPGYGYGQQPSYGYGYGGQREHPQGTTILVLGICSLVICGFLGPVAWVMGNNALKEIDANPSAYTNRGSVSAGRICGIITSVLMILGLVVIVIAVIAAAGSGSST
ncbi:hypothetical protein BH10ACT1_BH10ACT1_15250 [soil metagenome]